MLKRLIDLRAAAEYLGISHHFLYKLTARKAIDHVRMGRKILFDVRKLESFIEENSIESVDWSSKYGI